jgi:uncharacterized protein YukE
MAIEMQFDVVESVATTLATACNTVETAHKTLKNSVATFETTSLKGAIGDAQSQFAAAGLLPELENIYKKLAEMAVDVQDAVRVVRDSDKSASTKFAK